MSLSNRLGLLGRKVGMMRIFTDDGDAVPVTVLDVSNNRVTQVKTEETDGYSALQVAFGTRKASRVNKPDAGHLAKAGVEAGAILKEFRVTAEVAAGYKPGAQVPVGFRGDLLETREREPVIPRQQDADRQPDAVLEDAVEARDFPFHGRRPRPGAPVLRW